jgi:hypothetical protein
LRSSVLKAEYLDARLFVRQAVIPVWIFGFGLVAIFASPSGLTKAVLLLIVLGLVVPFMTLWLWNGAGPYTLAVARLPPLDVEMIIGGLRQRRGPRRQDEGRS